MFDFSSFFFTFIYIYVALIRYTVVDPQNTIIYSEQIQTKLLNSHTLLYLKLRELRLHKSTYIATSVIIFNVP